MYDAHIHPTREHATLILDARASSEMLASRIMRSIETRSI
jgi:hypothetical protein